MVHLPHTVHVIATQIHNKHKQATTKSQFFLGFLGLSPSALAAFFFLGSLALTMAAAIFVFSFRIL